MIDPISELAGRVEKAELEIRALKGKLVGVLEGNGISASSIIGDIGGGGNQIIIPATDLNTHASTPKSPLVPWMGGAWTGTARLFYHTLPTSAVAQTWKLQRSAAGGAFADVITITCAATTPMLYTYTGDVGITLADLDRLQLIHTAGDNSGVLVTVVLVKS